jgi:predicted transcriptional regulator
MKSTKRVISHRLKENLITRLDKLAVKKDRSRTYLIEKAIEEYLYKQENPETELETTIKKILSK